MASKNKNIIIAPDIFASWSHYQLTALEMLGQHRIQEVRMHKNFFQVEALRFFGVSNVDNTLKITQHSQFEAAKYLGLERINDIVKFEYIVQVNVLSVMGVNLTDIVLQFDSLLQLEALNVFFPDGASSFQHIRDVMELKSDYADLYKRIEDSLKFEYYSQLKALKILGADRASDALEVMDHAQLAAYLETNDSL